MRAASTLVDASVFLLLVSGAVLTLHAHQPPQQRQEVTVDETAETLATTTTTVNYTVPTGRTAPGTMASAPATVSERRSVHGTHAGLLARAVLANLTIDGRHLSEAGSDYASLVANETQAVLNHTPGHTQVVARWAPYPSAPIRGLVRVGQNPPQTVDVEAATLRVPVTGASPRPSSGQPRTFESVARDIATQVLALVGPREQVGTGSAATAPARAITRKRYETIGAETATALTGDVDRNRGAVQSGLTRHLARDLRGNYETPTAARRALTDTHVTITVRRWDA